MTASKPMNAAEWAMLLTLSVLWGGSFFFQGVAVKELPTFTVVVVRVVLAALMLLLYMRSRGIRMPWTVTVWTAFLCMGVLNNVLPFTLIVWGQNHIASGVAAILNATTPMFTVLVAHVLTTDEKLTPAKGAGVVLGFAGVAAMIGGDVFAELGTNVIAQLAVLAGALSYAFAGVYGRRFRRLGVPPLATATGQVVASSVILIPMMLVIERPWTLAVPGMETVWALAGLALLSTAVAYVLYFKILESAGATNLLLVTFLIPVSAIALGIGVLGETLEPRHMGGLALIAAGLAAIDGRVLRRS